ncbi:aminotransferase class V-fold PLP-dependent enzyme [Robiginitomaculum antarcticum]|uniref:aminotransferase class V-fold PLP-dependent enzyme n=1 Tax=Robiginitomaculum antarcticum TaxID=437507 RepID=UPI00036A2F33|nr:aminotransferase class V-fold PLP-dependent enzyme [Robiginitomaculum antarcticum]
MRKHFHVPDNYFLSHSVGCLPKAVQDAVSERYFGPWISGENWAQWMSAVDGFRAGVARLLSVKASTVCPQTNISSALTKILYSLPREAGRNVIVLSKSDFPTIGFVFKQAEQHGFKIRYVEKSPTEVQGWADAIDKTVALVHITHALSNTSHILPVEQICTLAKAAGASSVVDAAQSCGIAPVTPALWGADFLTGTGVKFLCAGPGACFLYVSPDMISRCAPIDVGWFSHENPFEMDIERFTYADDAMRFFGGTPSPAPLVSAVAALTLLGEIGQDNVIERVKNHIATLTADMPDDVLVSPRNGQPHGAAFVVAPTDRSALRAAVKANDILCDEREEGFRFSVHGYISDTEVAALRNLVLAHL